MTSRICVGSRCAYDLYVEYLRSTVGDAPPTVQSKEEFDLCDYVITASLDLERPVKGSKSTEKLPSGKTPSRKDRRRRAPGSHDLCSKTATAGQ